MLAELMALHSSLTFSFSDHFIAITSHHKGKISLKKLHPKGAKHLAM
jgi:hypothetical protein